MGSVFAKILSAIEKENAMDEYNFIVLSYYPSAWTGEHYFSVNKKISGLEMAHMTGDYLTKVFEGPYKNTPKWEKEMIAFVEKKGKRVKRTYFFYTTCPKCGKFYGKNYVIAVSEIEQDQI